MRSVSAALAGAALLAVSVVPSNAYANGRFPLANQLVVAPDDPSTLFVRTTFGLLVSHDGGSSMGWICERAVGYGGEQDPAIAVFGGGSYAVAAFEGVSVSHDAGCSFALYGGALAGEFVIDVSVERAAPLRGVVVTSTGIGMSHFRVQVFETEDGGSTFTPAGIPLDPDLLAETIDVAPSRPERLYVSGTSTLGGHKVGVVAVSDDRGASWARTEIDLAGDASVYLAGVDPTDPDRVYVRSRASANDRLLVSRDGGKSFFEAASIPGSMQGFALSPDGARIAIGGPTAGLYLGDRDTLSFAPRATLVVSCLTWSDVGLYACTKAAIDGFSLALSADGGATFVPVLGSLPEIEGPLQCPPGTSTSTCGDDWAKLDLGPNGGAGGTSGLEPARENAVPEGDDGCDFRRPPAGPGHGAAAAIGALLLAIGSRRRKGS
jgi:hypothetical protein